MSARAKPVDLFQNDLHVVNLGLRSFADSIRAAGGTVVHVDWRPPAGGDSELARILEGLRNDDDSGWREPIASANAAAGRMTPLTGSHSSGALPVTRNAQSASSQQFVRLATK